MITIARIYGNDGDEVMFYWDIKSQLIYGQGHFVGDVWGPITPEDYSRKHISALVAQQYLGRRFTHLKSEDKEFYKL